MESRVKTKLSTWPSPQDYNEAIQNLGANTVDAQLRSGRVNVTGLGLPRPLTGAFASVYRVDSQSSSVAVRCFLRDISDQESRYEHISNFVQNDSLPYTVNFAFLRQGIRVGTNWFPALKMDWVSGPNLDAYIAQNLNEQYTLGRLAKDFREMCADLCEAGIAHGDLQHGNIIVAKEGLRLVDYDGMFVPAMSGMHSNELGHRNYQHPKRAATHFNAQLDNFSAWAIYTSICCTALDPRLWIELNGGDDCLLFRRDDFTQPEHSYAFNVLEQHSNPDIRKLAQFMRWLCHQSIEDVPPLTEIPPAVRMDLPPLSTPVRNMQPVVVRSARAESKAVTEPVSKPKRQAAVIPGVEDELNQPLPRWVAKQPEAGWLTSIQDEDFVASGHPARTIQLSIKQRKDNEGYVTYFAKYKFVVNGLVYPGEMKISAEQGIRLGKVNQCTVLYDPANPDRSAIYAFLPYRAVKVQVPADIEPELSKRWRSNRRRKTVPYRYYLLPLVAACIGFLTLAMFYFGTGEINAWLLVILTVIPIWMAGMIESKHRHLISVGVPSRARVLSIHPADGDAVRIKYRYNSHSGPIQSDVTTRDTNFTSAKIGDKITVLYDIDKPYDHIVYKLSSFEVP